MFNRNHAAATPQVFGLSLHSSQSPVTNITEFLRTSLRRFAAWRRSRREREELYAFLASDHRAAADIGYPHRLP